MLRANHTILIVLSGLVWLVVGFVLLPLGLNFIIESILKDNLLTMYRPVLDFLAPYAGGLEPAALTWIAICLFVGYMKGKYIFGKTVQKGVQRIQTLPNPAPLSQIYTKKYYLLLGSMVLLGFIVKLAPVDIRGGIDVAIGAALINGAMLYFKSALIVSRQPVPVKINRS